jgi:hypothetical protein
MIPETLWQLEELGDRHCRSASSRVSTGTVNRSEMQDAQQVHDDDGYDGNAKKPKKDVATHYPTPY